MTHRWQHLLALFVAGPAWLLLPTVGCSSAGVPRAASPAEREDGAPRTCLVLSVGAERGLAHLGVITALRERGVEVECVVGNSMGALIGGLLAHEHEADPTSGYRSIFHDYRARSFQAAGPFGVARAFGFEASDWGRLRETLRAHFGSVRIESLPLSFVTGYQVPAKEGLRYETVRGGLLADEIARSIKNPFLFPDIEVAPGQALDPGSDRLAAVPLAEACRLFPEHHFIVSNVTQHEAVLPRKQDCTYEELMILTPDVEAARALQAEHPAFGSLVARGHEAAVQELDWLGLTGAPRAEVDPAVPPLQYVDVSVRARLDETRGDAAWDVMGGAPDPRMRVVIDACEGCDHWGTAAGWTFDGQRKDGLVLSRDYGLLPLRRGFEVAVSAHDEDVTGKDEAGSASLRFDGVTETKEARIDHGEIRVIFTLQDETRQRSSRVALEPSRARAESR